MAAPMQERGDPHFTLLWLLKTDSAVLAFCLLSPGRAPGETGARRKAKERAEDVLLHVQLDNLYGVRRLQVNA